MVSAWIKLFRSEDSLKDLEYKQVIRVLFNCMFNRLFGM